MDEIAPEYDVVVLGTGTSKLKLAVAATSLYLASNPHAGHRREL